MLLILVVVLLNQGDDERAMELLLRAREAIPFQNDPRLVVISLVSYSFEFLFKHTNYIQ